MCPVQNMNSTEDGDKWKTFWENSTFSDLRYRLLVEFQSICLPVDVLVGPPEPDVVQGDDAVPLGR